MRINPLRVVSVVAAIVALSCDADLPTDVIEPAPPSSRVAASSGPPVQTGVIRATFPDNVCGIDVTGSVFVAGALFGPVLPGGVPTKQTGTTVITWTAANGKSVQRRGAGQILQRDFGVDEDGTFRVVEVITGLLGQLKTPDGPVILADVGKLALRQRIRLNPDGSATVLESAIVESAGPHPIVESGLALFCEVVTDALN